jgi:hypothetical protein
MALEARVPQDSVRRRDNQVFSCGGGSEPAHPDVFHLAFALDAEYSL